MSLEFISRIVGLIVFGIIGVLFSSQLSDLTGDLPELCTVGFGLLWA